MKQQPAQRWSWSPPADYATDDEPTTRQALEPGTVVVFDVPADPAEAAQVCAKVDGMVAHRGYRRASGWAKTGTDWVAEVCEDG